MQQQEIKHIVILAADGVMSSQITGVMDFFMICNRYWQVRNGGAEYNLFNVTVVSASGKNLQCSSNIILPAQDATSVATPDAVFITGGVSYDQTTLADYYHKLSPLMPLLIKWHKQQLPICAFCSSTFVLAELGLLDGKQATSVWWLANLFQQLYPAIELRLDQLVVNDENIYTAGATTSYLSLCLALVSLLTDQQIATQIAKIMLVEPNRASQLSYMSLQTFEQHSDTLVNQIQKWMSHNIASPISLDTIAEKFAITKRTLNRRFKRALNDTPVSYLQRMRVEAAKRLLESSDLAIEQIVYEVGYEDVSSFRKLFMEIAELSPKAYRDKFHSGFGINIGDYQRSSAH
ncbi:helix-turn-helix domain-containing protein [Psychrosphaera aquimarina]|uniref:Helix-turn-helix domain-containing protein n=1 Tax=Psychrosphaera aquimarina TaxID=2044854 RepID=A0ABU3QY85_9GAMM|nr:helix-turn-helix domain-containing protein [Psychrosphaera aquimarina]MDU0112393.1 helix-turn-helix domain-containing protein [Psychrosphaera aquimarina]